MARFSTHLSPQQNPFSGKFSAKDLGAAPYLSRERLLLYMHRQSKKRYVVALQGQPGQGKSVLAAQYLAMFDCASVWCAMDEADQEPQQLLFSLLSACCYGLDRFECAHLEEIFRSESVLDLRYAVSLLLTALDQHIGKDLYLVLDDLHHLAAAPASLEVIQNLLDGASDRIHILLLSRLNVVGFLGVALEQSNALLINNQQLSFYLGEIQELHVANFNQYLSEDECKVLLRYTHGWPVAVDLYAQYFEESQRSYQDLIEQNYFGQGFFDYLKTTAFDWLSEELRQFSLQIAYLDRVTPEMAEVISGRTDAESLLQELLSQHGFIKPPLMGQEAYSLLPIWGAFLREKSVSLFQADYGDALYLRLAHFWAGKGEHEKAIVCCLKAKKPQEVDVIFEKSAAKFLDQESSSELHSVLVGLDEAVVKRSPWISLLYANEMMMKQPERAYGYFKLARKGFAEQKNRKGELLSLSQKIYFHVTIDGRHYQLPAIVGSAGTLYQELKMELSLYEQVHVSSLLNFANFFVNPQEYESQCYEVDALLRLSVIHNMEKLTCRLRLYRLLELILLGQLRTAKPDMEFIYLALMSGKGSDLERCLMFAAVGYWMNQASEHEALKVFTRQTLPLLDDVVLNNSLSGTLFRFWEIKRRLMQGHYHSARDCLREALTLYQVSSEAPFFHYLKMYDLFITAQVSNEDVTPYLDNFKAVPLNARLNVVMAAIYAYYEKWPEAHQQLDIVANVLSVANNGLTEAGLFFHRSWLFYQEGESEKLRHSLLSFSEVMRAHDYRSCYLFLPDMAKVLFEYAIKENIERVFFESILQHKLALRFEPKSGLMPILEIKSLGNMAFSRQGDVVLKQSELTQMQRALLALLISSRDLQLEQSVVQRVLWPEDDAEQARRKLDVTLSRLRSTFNKVLSPFKANTYIQLKHGILSLTGVSLDADVFLQQGDKGLKLYQGGKRWEAAICLINALSVWQGEFCLEMDVTEKSVDFRVLLSCKFQRYSRVLAAIFEQFGQYEDAIELLLPIFYQQPSDDDLMGDLDRLHRVSDNRQGGARLLVLHREALDKEAADEE